MKTVLSIVLLIILFMALWAFLIGRAVEKNNQEKAHLLQEIQGVIHSPEKEWPVPAGKDVKG